MLLFPHTCALSKVLLSKHSNIWAKVLLWANDSLWAKVLLSKYCSRQRMKARDPDSLPCSPTWKAIKVGFLVFEKGVYWSVGSKSTLNFWESKWVKGCSIREQITGPLSPQDASLTVADVFHDGQWAWDKISFDLTCMIVDKIKATPIQLFGDKEDTLMWKFFLRMVSSVWPWHIHWLDPRTLMANTSQVVGFGNLIRSQKSTISFGFAFTTAFLSEKSLLQGESNAMWFAPFAKLRKNQFFIF